MLIWTRYGYYTVTPAVPYLTIAPACEAEALVAVAHLRAGRSQRTRHQAPLYHYVRSQRIARGQSTAYRVPWLSACRL